MIEDGSAGDLRLRRAWASPFERKVNLYEIKQSLEWSARSYRHIDRGVTAVLEGFEQRA
jgi:hypothetical protein